MNVLQLKLWDQRRAVVHSKYINSFSRNNPLESLELGFETPGAASARDTQGSSKLRQFNPEKSPPWHTKATSTRSL